MSAAKHWIIVGAGSAGCVAAARMAGDGTRRVTLLDAGPDLLAEAVPASIAGPDFLAALEEPGRMYPDLVAQRSAGSDRTVYRRGRGIGGSSAVNAMLALRGDPALYESWGWDDAETAWSKVQIPCESPRRDELGPVDLALMAADDGAEIALLTRKQGRRVTSAEAYLWPLAGSLNLNIQADTPVQRVCFEGKRACGVELANGEVLDADRVVVAAGAIHTPAILLRSGVATPGVGMGLQDHPSAAFSLQLHSGVSHDEANGLAIGSLLDRGKIQLLPMNHVASTSTQAMGLLMVALMAPVSRGGSVSLDPDGDVMQPTVDFKMLSDERDVASLSHGVHLAMKLLRTPAFQTIVESVYIDEFGTTLNQLADGDSIASWVRSYAGDYVHASSSCAMGRVVDQDGAVLGYEALAVCDASVFPSIPHVNTHLPTTMLAERLSARWCKRERMTQ